MDLCRSLSSGASLLDGGDRHTDHTITPSSRAATSARGTGRAAAGSGQPEMERCSSASEAAPSLSQLLDGLDPSSRGLLALCTVQLGATAPLAAFEALVTPYAEAAFGISSVGVERTSVWDDGDRSAAAGLPGGAQGSVGSSPVHGRIRWPSPPGTGGPSSSTRRLHSCPPAEGPETSNVVGASSWHP